MVRALESAIRDYITHTHPQPFVWPKTADDILASILSAVPRPWPGTWASIRAPSSAGGPGSDATGCAGCKTSPGPDPRRSLRPSGAWS